MSGPLKQLVGRGTWARARANPHPEQKAASRWVRKVRLELGMSQSEFAFRLQVARGTVVRWEGEGGQFPRASHVARVKILRAQWKAGKTTSKKRDITWGLPGGRRKKSK